MEIVLAYALLWNVRFCVGEDYRRALDSCSLAAEDRRLLTRLANLDCCRESRTDTARLATRILKEDLAELDATAFAEALFTGIERARRMVRFEPESFARLGYALWLDLPEALRKREPFVNLKEEFRNQGQGEG